MSRLDKSTTDVFINWIHHLVHAGRLYTISDIDVDVDVATPKEYLFIPLAEETHIAFQVFATGGITLELFEGTTVSDNGSALTAQNNNRVHRAKSPQMQSFQDPTVTAPGTLLLTEKAGISALTPIGTTVAQPRQEEEVVFDDGLLYLLRFTPDADGTLVSFISSFYEVG